MYHVCNICGLCILREIFRPTDECRQKFTKIGQALSGEFGQKNYDKVFFYMRWVFQTFETGLFSLFFLFLNLKIFGGLVPLMPTVNYVIMYVKIKFLMRSIPFNAILNIPSNSYCIHR